MEQDNIIKGIVKAVRKDNTGLLLLKSDGTEQWFKGVGNALKYIKPELKGNEVELHLVSNTAFSFLKTLTSQKESDSHNSKDDYWQRREQREIVKETKMAKGASLNTAIEILKQVSPPAQNSNEMYSKALALAKIIFLEINKEAWK